jgi:hypothetical protein
MKQTDHRRGVRTLAGGSDRFGGECNTFRPFSFLMPTDLNMRRICADATVSLKTTANNTK